MKFHAGIKPPLDFEKSSWPNRRVGGRGVVSGQGHNKQICGARCSRVHVATRFCDEMVSFPADGMPNVINLERQGPTRAGRSRVVRVVLLVFALLGLGVAPGGAQSDDSTTTTAPATEAESTTTIDVEAEKARVDAAEAAKAREVNAANAELSDLTSALSVLHQQVASQQARVDLASGHLALAEQIVTEAEAEVATAEIELADLETNVGIAAIRSFVGGEEERAVLFAIGDPNKALRMEEMRAQATQSDLDLVEDLRGAQEDLVVRRAEALEAVAAADQLRIESEQALTALRGNETAQANLAASAEDRLDHLLAERAALSQLGADLDGGLNGADELANQLAATPPRPPPAQVTPPDVVTEADIARAGKGIDVHVSIVDTIRRLLADADAAGVDLAGGGYRSAAGQIATRKNNCGTSNYAVYEMPASQCRPPTARPGRSMHEKGLAIDFTYNGSLIRSRSGRGWEWLKANAANYGLKNLPSEPWHWSINGR